MGIQFKACCICFFFVFAPIGRFCFSLSVCFCVKALVIDIIYHCYLLPSTMRVKNKTLCLGLIELNNIKMAAIDAHDW